MLPSEGRGLHVTSSVDKMSKTLRLMGLNEPSETTSDYRELGVQ